MPLVINTNVAAINAQRQLVNSGNDMSQAMERLASGKRINTARDDAAGLAISNRQTSQIRGLNQAIRNANDGVSLIQTAEGALDEVTNILQRMRELSIQSANGIYSDLDRSTLDAEVQQLKQEVDRIAKSTTFNGQPLLDGSLSDVALQVGSEAYQTIDLSIQGFSASSLGTNQGDYVGEQSTGLGALTALAGGDELEINDVVISALDGATTVNEALDIMNADLDGKGAEVSTLVSVVASAAGNGVLAPTDTFEFNLVDGDGNTQSYVITDTSSLEELVDKINEGTGVEAKINSEGRMVLTAVDAQTINVTTDVTAATGTLAAATQFSLVLSDTSNANRGVKIENAGALTDVERDNLGINIQDNNENWLGVAVTVPGAALNSGDLIINAVEIGTIAVGANAAAQTDLVIEAINLLSDEHGVVAYEVAADQIGLRSASQSPIQIKYGDGAAVADVEAATGFQQMNAAEGTGSVAGIRIDTAAGAQSAIDVLDTAMEQINATRSDLGAINNRLDFTMSNLANVSEKTSAARSRIVDADFASETSELSRAQVLQQASQAMLAQANAQPQQVLQLLQG